MIGIHENECYQSHKTQNYILYYLHQYIQLSDW